MDNFAFIIHPIDPKRDVSRKYPLLGRLPEAVIDFGSLFFPPVYLSEVVGIRSQETGVQAGGWLLACPLTPRRMLELPLSVVYHKIIQTGRLAEKLGAKILGLGAFTSVVGDGGETIARHLDIPVTTGDAYTVSIAVEAARDAAAKMGINLAQATAAVVGAGGAVGRVCAQRLTGQVARLLLFGRRVQPLEELQQTLSQTSTQVALGADMQALRSADIVLAVSSATDAIIQPEHLRSGAVVCDVARPRDVAARVAAERDDVLVIDGGMVDVPGPANFNFDFGFPPGKAYACMAETIALTLEGRFEDYTLGKRISSERVDEITRIAARHGFRLSGLRSFEQDIHPAQIDSVRKRARLRLGAVSGA